MSSSPDPPPTTSSWTQRLKSMVEGKVAQPVARAIAANTGWLMLERIGIQGIRFFVGVWMIRYLGPDQYGVYSYALSVVVLMSTFSALGLDNIVTRECSRSRDEPGRVLVTAFWLRFGAAIVMALLTAGAILTIEQDPLVQFAVLIISVRMVFDASFIADFWFQSQIQSKYSVVVRSGGAVCAAALQVGAILADASVLVFLGILAVQSSLQALGFAAMIRRHGPPLSSFSPSGAIAKRLLRDSWPLMISAFSTMVYMKVDQIMLKQMATTEAVGVYASAVKLSEVWYFIPIAFASSVFPEIVRLREDADRSEYLDRVQNFYDLTAAVVYVVTFVVTLSAPYIVPWIFGESYAGAGTILQIHVWSFIFIGLGVARGKWLIAENLTRLAMMATLMGAVVNVVLNLVLIPEYGGIGAAWSTLVSYAVYAYFSLLLSKKTRTAFVQVSKAIVAPVRYMLKLFSSSRRDPGA